MVQVVYVKDIPKAYREAQNRVDRIRYRKRDRLFFGSISLLGLISIIFAVWPYVFWHLSVLPKLSGDIKNIPIPKSEVLSVKTALAANVQVVQDADGFSYFSTIYRPEGQRPQEFLLSIPKLKIEKAQVKVDSIKFDSSLAHFPGSALPGEVGNSFITGHSVLPQFNDPKNYRAIFTRLSDLEIGDDVYVEMEDKTYHYSVQYSRVVDPHDLSVLAPISQNSRNLTLMTCVPPGTNIKRLVVITSLI